VATERFNLAARLYTLGVSSLAASSLQYFSQAPSSHTAAAYAAFATVAQAVGGLISNLAASKISEGENQELANRNHLIRRGMAKALVQALRDARLQSDFCEPPELYNKLLTVWCDQLDEALRPASSHLEKLFPIEVSETQWEVVTRYDAHYDQEWLSNRQEKIRAGYAAESEQDAEALADLLWDLADDPPEEPPSILSGKLRAKWGRDGARSFARNLLPLYRVEFAKIFSAGGATSDAIDYKGMTLALEKLVRLQSQVGEVKDEVVGARQDIREVLAGIARLNRQERPSAPREFATNIPNRCPPYFMGRDQALAEIELTLKSHSVIALLGMRGSGKSTVAIAYADGHRADYRATWWIRAETPDGMREDLVALGIRLGWVKPDEKEDIPFGDILKRLADEGDKILLIYDNALDAKMLRDHLPPGGSSHVLITSHAGHVWGGLARRIEIRLWPLQISADYLIARTGRDGERVAAENLSEALDGLPLALEQAAAYCERLKISLAEYGRLFKARPLVLMGRDAPLDHATVAKSFALAIEEAAKLHPAAEPLIAHIALLPANAIPLFLLVEGKESFGEPLASLLADDGLDEALAALLAFALINREEIPDERNPEIKTDTISLHRLVREIAAGRCVGESRESALGALIRAVAAVYPPDDYLNLLTNWPRARRLDSLAFALVGDGVPLPPDSESQASDLMEKLAAYRHATTAAYAQVRALLDRALAIRKSMPRPDHPGVAEILNKLALLSWLQGDSSAALLLCEDALVMRETVLPPGDPDIGRSHINMARILLDRDDIASARNHCEIASSIFKAAFGPDHPDVATSLAVLGHVNEGNLSLAQPLFEAAQRIYEKSLGPDHPAHAGSLLNLAEVSERQGDLAAARQYIERALSIYVKTVGPDHRLVAYSLSRLATILQSQGDAPTARLSLQNALAINEKWLGPKHSDCISIRKRLDDASSRQSA
jgi:tetratricopeptide (TPR) repeat protein